MFPRQVLVFRIYQRVDPCDPNADNTLVELKTKPGREELKILSVDPD